MTINQLLITFYTKGIPKMLINLNAIIQLKAYCRLNLNKLIYPI